MVGSRSRYARLWYRLCFAGDILHIFCHTFFSGIILLKGGFEIHLTEGRRIRVQKGEILLFSNVPAVDSGGFSAECFQGAAVFSDILSVADKRRSLCGLMLDTEQVATLMTSHKGYLYVGNNSWSRAVFAMLTKLPVKKWGPYCAFKTIELLYLLCCGALPLQETPGEYFDGYQLNIIRQIHAFIRTHLEEDLRIEKLAEQFHVSQTMLKKCFRSSMEHRYIVMFQRAEWNMRRNCCLLPRSQWQKLPSWWGMRVSASLALCLSAGMVCHQRITEDKKMSESIDFCLNRRGFFTCVLVS